MPYIIAALITFILLAGFIIGYLKFLLIFAIVIGAILGFVALLACIKEAYNRKDPDDLASRQAHEIWGSLDKHSKYKEEITEEEYLIQKSIKRHAKRIKQK